MGDRIDEAFEAWEDDDFIERGSIAVVPIEIGHARRAFRAGYLRAVEDAAKVVGSLWRKDWEYHVIEYGHAAAEAIAAIRALGEKGEKDA